jgi:hypothetical protein
MTLWDSPQVTFGVQMDLMVPPARKARQAPTDLMVPPARKARQAQTVLTAPTVMGSRVAATAPRPE